MSVTFTMVLFPISYLSTDCNDSVSTRNIAIC